MIRASAMITSPGTSIAKLKSCEGNRKIDPIPLSLRNRLERSFELKAGGSGHPTDDANLSGYMFGFCLHVDVESGPRRASCIRSAGFQLRPDSSFILLLVYPILHAKFSTGAASVLSVA